MRIKNLAASTVYMGYESPGFYLASGAVSDELPDEYFENPVLEADVSAGRVAIVGRKASKKAGTPLAAVPEVKAEKPAPISAPVPEAPVGTAHEPQTPPDAPSKMNPLKDDIRGQAERIASPEDKKKYLVTTIAEGSGAAAKAAAEVLIDIAKKESDELKSGEAAKPAVKPEEPVRTKSYGNMNKLELLTYALGLGIDATPATEINTLRKLVKEKLKEKEGN